MSYDEELEYLRKEFKKSEAKFREAEREGWHTDANIYEDNMANLGYQINIHEQAAKADEYEAKAKAFDSLKNKLENEVNILRGNVSGFPYVDAPIDSSIRHFERILEMIKKLESGGSND